MKNKKTTIAGILLLIGAVATGVAGVMSGTMTATEAMAAVAAALTGAGFLVSGDGGL
jgi:hypothetical protein